jgi:hypothetical protein
MADDQSAIIAVFARARSAESPAISAKPAMPGITPGAPAAPMLAAPKLAATAFAAASWPAIIV